MGHTLTTICKGAVGRMTSLGGPDPATGSRLPTHGLGKTFEVVHLVFNMHITWCFIRVECALE